MRQRMCEILEQVAKDYKGTIVSEFELYEGHDIHAFYRLKADETKAIHVQAYPGLSTEDEMRVWARMMDYDKMKSIREKRQQSIGNEHEAVIEQFPNFDTGVNIPYDAKRLEQMLNKNMPRGTMLDMKMYLPEYMIEENVYVPQKERVMATKVIGYDALVREGSEELLAGVQGYHLEKFASVRRGESSRLTSILYSNEIFDDEEKAKKASRFLTVEADEKIWMKAIGDREDHESMEESDLPPCCADISEARDILIYCKKQEGLLVCQRDELDALLEGHGYHYEGRDAMAGILEQLKIKK